jgi:diguanylate cyclase
MRYQESTAKSAELLRMILPRIAKHGGSCVPTTYAVWYEYLAGVNPALATALDQRLQASPMLTQAEFEELHARYIDKRELGAVEQFQVGLQELLQRLGEIAATSGQGTAEYTRALAECEQQLSGVSDSDGLNRVIQSLVKSTSAVRASTESLQQEVLAARNEVQQLRGQMGALQNLAHSDPLTRLRNRRGFELEAAAYAQGREQGLLGCSVMMADIDHFKRVNDTYGHLFGDEVICAVAQLLQRNVKGRDIAARWGGEEFTVLLPETPAEGAMAVAEQLRAALSKSRIRRGGKQQLADSVTISIGVAAIAEGETLEQATERADAALYQAKQAGRNCVRLAEPGAAPAAAASAQPPMAAAR